MARKRRVWIPNKFYHIVSRGNRRDPLFRNSDDFQAFLYILTRLHERILFELASYCLMTNHYHLQLRSQEQSISKVMSLLNKRYADYYNNRYSLSGHVFEKRFFDRVIYDQVGMLRVSYYIHFNPLEANIVGKPEHYPWSSYHLFKEPNEKEPPFMNIQSLLCMFTGTKMEKKEKYRILGACHRSKFVEHP